MNVDYSYQLSNEESLSSHYANTGDDYENSNIKMHEYNTYSDNKAFVNYHSNGNQSQFKDDTAVFGQSKVISNGTKILPTVPPAGSTGKKLPTVNGKSGLLTKQMPTEIYDDESELEEVDVGSSIGKKPIYHIDSEQDDYYMGLQQTTPSNQANGYYEHVNNGYDYREDYFNEEDEYKYLEQQREQEQLHQPKNKKYLKQTKGLLSTTQPQSSLDFIDEGQAEKKKIISPMLPVHQPQHIPMTTMGSSALNLANCNRLSHQMTAISYHILTRGRLAVSIINHSRLDRVPILQHNPTQSQLILTQ